MFLSAHAHSNWGDTLVTVSFQLPKFTKGCGFKPDQPNPEKGNNAR